jgi:hypothetical protein
LDPDPAPVIYAVPIPDGARLLDQKEAARLVDEVGKHLASFPDALNTWRKKVRSAL